MSQANQVYGCELSITRRTNELYVRDRDRDPMVFCCECEIRSLNWVEHKNAHKQIHLKSNTMNNAQ